ncbi:MAG: hypothetical protein WA057_00700 [Candidatus Magasanikiibacteriota bacterium]
MKLKVVALTVVITIGVPIILYGYFTFGEEIKDNIKTTITSFIDKYQEKQEIKKQAKEMAKRNADLKKQYGCLDFSCQSEKDCKLVPNLTYSGCASRDAVNNTTTDECVLNIKRLSDISCKLPSIGYVAIPQFELACVDNQCQRIIKY